MVIWRRAVPVLSALALVAGLVTPAGADPPRSPAECAAALDCTAADIDLMSMAQRLEFVRAMQSGRPRRWARRTGGATSRV
jgi:hypothetical protein